MDRISELIGRHALHAKIFFNGNFCGSNEFHNNGKLGQLHLVREGTVRFEHQDGSTFEVTRPAMVFYPRGLAHRLSVASSASLICANIAFDQGGYDLLTKTWPDRLHLAFADAPLLVSTLELLFAEASSALHGQNLILERLFDVLLVQLIRHQLQSGQLSFGVLAGVSDPMLSRALDAMHGAPQQPWRLEALAALTGKSRSKFARDFQEVLGISPGEYLSNLRIAKAQRLLEQGLPIKTVSREVGYSSQPVFSRAFAARTGVPPSAWQGRMRKR